MSSMNNDNEINDILANFDDERIDISGGASTDWCFACERNAGGGVDAAVYLEHDDGIVTGLRIAEGGTSVEPPEAAGLIGSDLAHGLAVAYGVAVEAADYLDSECGDSDD